MGDNNEVQRLFIFSLFERRAANKVYQTFRVNRFELWLLMAMVAVMGICGKKSAGKQEIFDMITGNTRAKRKFEGYWIGLQRAQLIRGATLKNGRNTWVLTHLAVKIITVFEREIERLETAQKKKEQGRRPNRKEFKVYPLNDLPPTVLEDLPPYYKSLN